MKKTRRMSDVELDISSWKYPDEGALPDGDAREAYFARKRAIHLYLQGATAQEIKAQAGIGIDQTRRLIKERCLLTHKDGEVWGWRALIPWERINAYQRKRKIVVDRFGLGAAGAFNAVLNAHPDLRDKFNRRILSTGRPSRLTIIKRNKQSHWNWFLDRLRELGYEEEGKWPFNTKYRGYISVCRYIKQILEENPEEAAAVVGGPNLKRKMQTGDGVDRPIHYIFQRVEMDAHKLDGRFSVAIPQQSGGHTLKIVHRLWVIVILEIVSRVVLGYHFSMRKEVSKYDVLRTIKLALSRWKKPPATFSDLAYVRDANLPSSASDQFVGVCWDETSVDGALAEVCKHVKTALKDVAGSELIEPSNGFSSRRGLDDRPFVETFFRTLGQNGFQRMSNSTGGKPSDRKGRKPEEIAITSQFQIEYANELLAVLIANYNAQPHTSLGGRSPLAYLQFKTMYPERSFRYADPNSVCDLVSYRKLCIVHGGFAEGRRPYVFFAHGRYSGTPLEQRHDLVGKKIWIVNHIEDDVRIVRASTVDGHPIGLLKVGPPWHKLPHSLEVRNAVASCIAQDKFSVNGGRDAIEVFIDFSERQTDKKLPVHPAYLEARRILVDVAEEITGRSMIEIANERASERLAEENKSRLSKSQALSLSALTSEGRRPLPSPRKAANK